MPKEVTFPPPAASSQVGLGEPSIPDSWAPTLLGSLTSGLRRNWVLLPLRVLWPGGQHPELPSGKPLTTKRQTLSLCQRKPGIFCFRLLLGELVQTRLCSPSQSNSVTLEKALISENLPSPRCSIHTLHPNRCNLSGLWQRSSPRFCKV